MAKTPKETKKAVIFIVEGHSDKEALEKIFQKIYKHRNIVFKFTDGDVTSNDDIDESNVCKVIYEKVEQYRRGKSLNKTDIWQIVHIFDTDGAYVPDNAAVEGTTRELWYTPTQISCKNVQKILDRNKKKRRMMDYLLTLQDIEGIPYIGYYMSSNLDHALYDEQNLSDELKGEYADAFYAEFENKEKLFIDYLKDEVANGDAKTFPASWRYIKEGLHSLERNSNLHFYFENNPIN